MNVEFLSAARIEFDEAAAYYNDSEPGLGDEFAQEVQQTIQRIVEFPEAWTLISQHARRCRTRRFPYGIIYQIRSEMVLIVGVMHLHRSPQAWRTRLPRKEQ